MALDEAGQLRAIADAVPALIAYVDATQRYRFNNQAYARWFGRTPDELRGKHISELLGATAYAALRPDIERVLTGEAVSYERLVPYEAGSRWTSTQFVPDVDAEGRVRGFVALVTDVTARKEAEEQLRRMHEQVEIADRLASVGTLALGVAHEVNNPLAIVIANQAYVMASLARLTAEWKALSSPDAAPRAIERIAAVIDGLEEPLRDARDAADRVRRIVRDLEVFASPDTNQREGADVHRVLASAVALLGDEIRRHSRLVETHGKVRRVDGNEALLGQVFLHLLRNASQAVAQHPGHENEIRVTTRANENGNVVVEVADTGCGIQPEHLGRIFDPFFTTKAVGAGMGLGLWVCSRIITQMGGTIDVRSEIGKGSVFTVTLPAASR